MINEILVNMKDEIKLGITIDKQYKIIQKISEGS